MMNKVKISGVVFAVCALAYFGVRSLAQPDSTNDAIPDPDTFSPNYRYSGLTLAPVPVELSGDGWMLSSLAEAKLWKFAVKVANPKIEVSGQLEVREKGKTPKVLCTLDPAFLAWDKKTKKSYIYVGILPLNAGFAEAQKIRCQIIFGGLTRTTIVDNPFMGNLMSGTPNPTQQQDVPLLDARIPDRQNLAKYHDLTMFLKLKTKTHP